MSWLPSDPMNVLFFSDIHGSPHSLALLQQRMQELTADKLVLLGDIFLCGGQSPLDSATARRQTAALLNQWQDKIIAVRGNCDRDCDQKLLNFPILAEFRSLEIDGHRFFLSHGHFWNPGHPPPLGTAEILVNGHTHFPLLARTDDGLICFNPGSLAIPRENFPPSFGFYSDQTLYIYPLNGELKPLDMLLL